VFQLQIAYALALAPVSYFGVRAVFTRYQAQLGKRGGIAMHCLLALLAVTPLLCALFEQGYLYSLSVIPATVLIPFWAGHELFADLLANHFARKRTRLLIKVLETIIEEDFDSIDANNDELLNEQDIVNASINFKEHAPDKAAALEQLLVNIAEVGHVVGVIEQETFCDDELIGTVRRNLYAVKKSDLRKYPAALRSKYQIW